MIKEKTCKSCNKTLDISHFTPSKNVKDGYENKCKKCRQIQKKPNHNHICQQCGKNFTNTKKDSKYCSLQCAGLAKRKRVEKKCKFCGNLIEVACNKVQKQDNFYCSTSCRHEHLKELMAGENNPNYLKVEYICDGCEKKIMVIPSKLENQKHIFCCNECYKKNIGKYITGKNNPLYVEKKKSICSECGKEFERKPGQFKYEISYCSRECYFKSLKEKKQKLERILIQCGFCGKDIHLLKSQTIGKKHIYCSRECQRKGHGKHYSGINHPRYNPELTSKERLEARKYNDYYKWRKKVYERDNYTCQSCNDDSGGNLVAHHLESYRTNENLRTSVENGITLCEKCHKLFHDNYGYGSNSKEQFIEFLIIRDLLINL
jgi:hypothetical protein